MIKNILIVLILSFIFFLYSFKYLNRFIEYSFVVSILFVFLYFLILIIILNSSKNEISKDNFIPYFFLLSAVLILAIVILSILNVENRLGREKAIHEWLKLMSLGCFPYGSSTKTNPSALPFLMLLYLPFKSINFIGAINIIAAILFVILSLKIYQNNFFPLVSISALLLHPFIYYESLLKSDIFFNSMLIITMSFICEKKLLPDKKNIFFYISSVAWGLLLSGRLAFILVYFILLFYKFRDNLRLILLYSSISFICFLATILPFLLWDFYTFIFKGPFAIQSLYSRSFITIAFIAISIITGYFSKNTKQLFFNSGIILFFIVFVGYFLPYVFTNGINSIFFVDGFDITYFNFCAPFLLLSFENKED